LTIHLRHMHVWKGYFKKIDQEYESDKVQLLKEKEMTGMDIFNQLGSIAQALGHEGLKFEALQKERETKEAKEKEAKLKLAQREKALKEEDKKKKWTQIKLEILIIY